MQFEWDENKNSSNQEKHGVDFNQAIEVWNDENRLETPDNRKDYGETRIKIIGKALNLMLSVIYTTRDTVTRLISARSASRGERKKYNEKNNDGNK